MDTSAALSAGAVIAELRDRLTEYRERVQFLERLTEYQAGQISELTRRIPELSPGSPTPAPPSTMPHTGAETPVAQRKAPWWERWFRR